MKRRQMLKLLGVSPIATSLLACESPVPRKDTIVTGTVIDEGGNPLEGVPFNFVGEKRRGSTFSIDVITDSLGQFKISQHVPKGTDWAWLFLRQNEKIIPKYSGNMLNANYIVYMEEGNIYQLFTTDVFEITRDKWGKTVTLNFKYEKI